MLNKTTTTAARTEICRRAILEVSTESFLQVVWSVEFGFCEGIDVGFDGVVAATREKTTQTNYSEAEMDAL